MSKNTEIIIGRDLTKQEKDWLIQGLQTLKTGEYFGGGNWIEMETGKIKPLDEPIDPQFFLNQIIWLRVVSKCDCGEPNCHTVRFQKEGYSKSRVAIVTTYIEDGRMLIIHIDEESGIIIELEVI